MRGTRHQTEIDVASRRQEIHAVATTFRVRASIHFVEESVEHILQDRIRVVVIIPKLGRLVPEQLPYFLLTFEVIRYRVVAPPAVQWTALQENGRANGGSVMGGESHNIKNKSLGNSCSLVFGCSLEYRAAEGSFWLLDKISFTLYVIEITSIIDICEARKNLGLTSAYCIHKILPSIVDQLGNGPANLELAYG